MTRTPHDLLPLGTLHFHVLVALGGEVMHGYGIIQAYEAMTEGRDTLLPGSLYSALSRMVELELLEEVAPPAGESSGGPSRRYYRVTAFGRAVARAESERMSRLVELARRQEFAPGER